MGYLSCKAESAVSISISHSPVRPKAPNSRENAIEEFNYSDLEAATDGFSDQKLLGKGSHGLVYKGVLRGGRMVAIKRPSRGRRACSTSEISTEVENEIDILSNLQSPSLVNLVGFAVSDTRDRLLVVEFMSNGTLYDVLHSNPRPPSWGRRLKLALHTAKAIDTLHSCTPPVIHRDIKSANVLIDKNFNAKLGDFGLALRCHVDDFRLRSTPPAGTMGYLDPAYVTPDNLSTKTDVFSFGILLLEIISGRKAIDVAYSPPSIVDWAIPLIRRGKLVSIYDPRIPPPRDALVRKQLAVVAAKCVRSCRERRPTMREVVECLNGLSKLLPLHSWNGFTNPCLMVETVGRPVGARNVASNVREQTTQQPQLEGEDSALVAARPLRNSRRVYSDLGLRSNLMDLMNGIYGESQIQEENDDSDARKKPMAAGFSCRFANEKIAGQKSSSSLMMSNIDKLGILRFSRDKAAGGEKSNKHAQGDTDMVRSIVDAQTP